MLPIFLFKYFTRLQIKPMPSTRGIAISTYRDGQYCGPGWGFTKKDLESGRIRKLPAAFDAIDQLCKAHDQCYEDFGYFTLQCDRALVRGLAHVVFSRTATRQHRVDAALMAGVFQCMAMTIDVVVRDFRRIKVEFKQRFDSGWTMEQIIRNRLYSPND